MQGACDSGNVGEVRWRTEEHDCGIKGRLCYKKMDVDYKYRSTFVMRECRKLGVMNSTSLEGNFPRMAPIEKPGLAYKP